MKIALFSDVHANLPALEAFFESIAVQKPDTIYCLGDLVGYNIWPNEVINEIRKRGIPTIAGNYDQGIGLATNECGCAYKTEEEKAMGNISITYTNSIVNKAQRNYLRTLPLHLRIEFQLNDKPFNLLLVHGSPRKINEYLFEDRPEESLLRIMKQANADILCFGHTHQPYHRILTSAETNGIEYLHAINIGSVGKPKDGDARGGYVLLTINADCALSNKNAINVEFVRFEYDVEKAAKAIEDCILPDDYARMLRQGV